MKNSIFALFVSISFASPAASEVFVCNLDSHSITGITSQIAAIDLFPSETIHLIDQSNSVMSPWKVLGRVTRDQNRIRMTYRVEVSKGMLADLTYTIIPSTMAMTINMRTAAKDENLAGAQGHCHLVEQ